jgi:predicted nuclease of restriction endonuclease-like (RecB) superfamily
LTLIEREELGGFGHGPQESGSRLCTEADETALTVPGRAGDPAGYAAFLDELKQRIRTAQTRAAVAVNRELVVLYWGIGREIRARQRQQGWGAKVIDRLAADLHRSFPEMRGFSARNLKYMRALAEAFPEEAFVQEVLAQITWYHAITLLDKVKDAVERDWYIRRTI